MGKCPGGGSHTLTTCTMTRPLRLALLGITFALLLHFSTARSIKIDSYNGQTIKIRDGRKYIVADNGEYYEDPHAPVPIGDRPIEDYEGVKYQIDNDLIYEVAVTVMPGKKKKYEFEYHVEVGDLPPMGGGGGGGRL